MQQVIAQLVVGNIYPPQVIPIQATIMTNQTRFDST